MHWRIINQDREKGRSRAAAETAIGTYTTRADHDTPFKKEKEKRGHSPKRQALA
jgi:hypothetical protein